MGNVKTTNTKKQKGDVWYTVMAIVIAAVLLVGILVAILKPTGAADYISLHIKSAMKSDNYSVNNAQLTYLTYATYSNYYSSYASGQYAQYITSVFGMDSSKPIDQQYYYNDKKTTWRDYCINEAETALTQVLVLCEAAKVEGFTLPEDQKEEIADVIQSIKDYAKKNNHSVATAIGNLYGSKGITLKDIEGLMNLQYLASSYASKLTDSYTYTDEEYNKFYDENKIDYLQADYYSYTVKAVYDTDADDATKAAAATAAIAKAKELSERITAGEKFIDVVFEYEQSLKAAETGTDDDDDDDDETTPVDEITKESLEKSCLKIAQVNNDAEVDKWVFAATPAENGAVKVIDATESSTIYQINKSAYRFEYKSVDLRELYITLDDFKDAAAMEEYAKKIVADYEALADKTSDNFGALAAKYTTEGDEAITVTDSDKIEEATKSTDADHEDVNTWLFDTARVHGDVKYFITEDEGIEIYFFDEFGREAWLLSVDADMRAADYKEQYETLEEQYKVTTNDKAVDKVGRS